MQLKNYRTGSIALREELQNAVISTVSGYDYLLSFGNCGFRTESFSAIGSVNLDVRSMKLDEENCAMIEDSLFVRQFMKQFQNDAEICALFDPKKAQKNTFGTRMIRFLYALV
jgi:hypothetical protein